MCLSCRFDRLKVSEQTGATKTQLCLSKAKFTGLNQSPAIVKRRSNPPPKGDSGLFAVFSLVPTKGSVPTLRPRNSLVSLKLPLILRPKTLKSNENTPKKRFPKSFYCLAQFARGSSYNQVPRTVWPKQAQSCTIYFK